MSQMTQHDDDSAADGMLHDLEALFDAVNELRNALWKAHGALELQEEFVRRMERQAENPGCRCAEQVFATIDGEGTLCKQCHDRWLRRQPVTYVKHKITSRW